MLCWELFAVRVLDRKLVKPTGHPIMEGGIVPGVACSACRTAKMFHDCPTGGGLVALRSRSWNEECWCCWNTLPAVAERREGYIGYIVGGLIGWLFPTPDLPVRIQLMFRPSAWPFHW